MQLLFIDWNVNPVIFDLGFIAPRYYTLLFGLGLFLSGWVVYKMAKAKGVSDDDFMSLTMYVFIGIVAGARLGHCLFYEPEYYLKHPLEMILPISFEDGGIVFTGYLGLASHGGAVGLIIALAIYCYKKKKNAIMILDDIAVAAPLAASFIRLGNLMNSEIIGHETTVPWAFRFMRVDGIPRHPAQLYEAIFYMLLFVINIWIYKRYKDKLQTGFLFGFTIVMIFAFRFFIEFIKENQVAFENNIQLNMGQLLSIPYVLVGIYFMLFYRRKTKSARVISRQ